MKNIYTRVEENIEMLFSFVVVLLEALSNVGDNVFGQMQTFALLKMVVVV